MTFEPLNHETLRNHKGKSFVGITTCFMCHDGKGKLFLTKRSKNARDEQGTWEFGGGGLLDDKIKKILQLEKTNALIALGFACGYAK